MKNSIYFLFLLLITFSACNNDNDFNDIPTCENCNFTCLDTNATDVITNDCINNWECNFHLFENSTIDLNELRGIITGDRLAFQMVNSTEGSPSISDDEFTNILVFELPTTQSSFSVSDTELESINLNFRRICFCTGTEFRAVTSGCIQGEQQTNGTWRVQGNLVIPYHWGDVEVKIDAQFVN